MKLLNALCLTLACVLSTELSTEVSGASTGTLAQQLAYLCSLNATQSGTGVVNIMTIGSSCTPTPSTNSPFYSFCQKWTACEASCSLNSVCSLSLSVKGCNKPFTFNACPKNGSCPAGDQCTPTPNFCTLYPNNCFCDPTFGLAAFGPNLTWAYSSCTLIPTTTHATTTPTTTTTTQGQPTTFGIGPIFGYK